MHSPRLLAPRSAYLILAGALFAACSSEKESAPAGDAHHDAHHWGYAAAEGPARWCDLDPANSGCCKGEEQSPIDVVTAAAVADHPPRLALQDPATVFDVANNGHTVQATLRSGAAKCGLDLGGAHYELQQFHVHAPSEHAIDGKHAPLELHFVHRSKDGGLAVVGVLVQPGEANEELEKVWSLAPPHKGDGGIAAGVDLTKVLPAARVNFRYPGSLTTPPCTEHVQWIVMETPITMSREQIGKIQGMFAGEEFPEGNARPVQPLGVRKIVVDLGY